MFFENYRLVLRTSAFLCSTSGTDWSQAMFTFCEHCVFWVTILVFASVGIMHAVKFAVLEYHEIRKAIQEAARK
jgi:uncharacterized membrane protein YagU involved in acid resistance